MFRMINGLYNAPLITLNAQKTVNESVNVSHCNYFLIIATRMSKYIVFYMIYCTKTKTMS